MDRALVWDRGTLKLLGRSGLPHQAGGGGVATGDGGGGAIRKMKVRGAPAIGAAAAYGLVLAAQTAAAADPPTLRAHLDAAARMLLGTRPTAVNLRWAVERMLAVAGRVAWRSGGDLVEALLAEAQRICEQDVRTNRAIGANGAALIRPGERILTYCNTGSLATVDYGTALGIIRAAHEQGKRIQVFVSETRPLLQGARLTAWEVLRYGIPATLIADNAAAWLMRQGLIDRVVVGADRVAANGDTANKIGTYGLAVLARAHEIPFLVAAPLSTVDFRAPDGSAIPIEERPPEEGTPVAGAPGAPEGIAAANPAFGITPHHLITAIVTEAGVATPPYTRSLLDLSATRAGR